MPVHVDDLGLDARLVARLKDMGFDALWPSQEEAAPIAASGRNVVVAVPTASGKSLIAYLALLNRALKGGKGLYLVPLRALASEKFEDLRELAKGLGLRVGITIGDLDDTEPHLAGYDIVVATSEKADALLRHKVGWLSKVSCVVADEVHLMNDPGRGPTMEVLLARFRQLNPEVQVVALSATIANSKELADWLDAEHVKSEWRPVTLREGIHYGRAVKFVDNKIHEVDSDRDDAVHALTEDGVRNGGQVLVFVNTRKSTEALAEKLAGVVRAHLPAATKAALKEAADNLKGTEDATTTEARLAKCLRGGAAFHHAGLTNTHRALVERLFKEGHVRALSATPTLAAGINLPARRVIIRDLYRFDANEGGNAPIPVLEYKQMAGRAGRPKYDKVGEAITIAKRDEQRQEILLSYVLADPEKVWSKLGTESALRAHILSSIAGGFITDDASLKDFIRRTFFAHQNDTWTILQNASAVLDFLLENDLVEMEGEKYRATRFGHRVSELYIDPLSAVKLRTALQTATTPGQRLTDMSFLHAVCATPDVRTLFMRRADGWVEGEAVEREEELLLPHPGGLEYDFFLAELKTACLLKDWMEEMRNDDLVKKYQVYLGDLQNKRDTAEWLVSAMAEISRALFKEARSAIEAAEKSLDRAALMDGAAKLNRLAAVDEALADAARWLGRLDDAAAPRTRGPGGFEEHASTMDGDFVTFAPESTKPEPFVRGGGSPGGGDEDPVKRARDTLDRLKDRLGRYRDVARELETLTVRVREGVRSELLPLLKFRGVGRYRARMLWNAEFKDARAIAAARVEDLARVQGIGTTIAESLKKEAGGGHADTTLPEREDATGPAPKDDGKGQRSLGDFGGGGP